MNMLKLSPQEKLDINERNIIGINKRINMGYTKQVPAMKILDWKRNM